MTRLIRIIALTAAMTAPFALAQVPASLKPITPAAPALTEAESVALADLQKDYNDLEKQRQEIVAEQQAIGAKYQALAAALAKEHPGYTLGANGQMVAEPKKQEKK